MKIFQKRLFLFLVIVLLMSITGAAVAQGSGAAPMIESKSPTDPEMANCIVGTVWYDGNHNGFLDEKSENVMDGASVTLLEIGPFQYQMGPYRLANHQVTRDGGTYEFCGLKPGSYEVRVQPSKSFVDLSMPVHTLNGTTYSDIWSGEDNVQSLFMTATANNPVQVKLNQGGYAEISVGFVLPTVTK
jgi:hypothetical protein